MLPHPAPTNASSVDPNHGSVYNGPIPKFLNYLWSSHSRRYLSVRCFRREVANMRTQHMQRLWTQQHPHMQHAYARQQQQQQQQALVNEFAHMCTYI